MRLTIAFGIRNVQDPRAGVRRVSPGAQTRRPARHPRVSTPEHARVRAAYLWYFRNVLPRIGRLVSRHGEAYTYLPASVESLHAPAQFVATPHGRGLTRSGPSL